MTYLPHTADEREQMLKRIGVERLEDLFCDLPEHLRFPDLSLADPCAEMDIAGLMADLAGRNTGAGANGSFLGAGTYRHYRPAIVDHVLQRGEFYTAYTPYQPEVSQGMLQAMFEYQTMICRLTGMEVSNASHYDGAASLAEAVLMALDVTRGKRSKIVMSGAVHPQFRQVVKTYLQGTDARVAGEDAPFTAIEELLSQVDDQTAALVIQNPNFFGQLADLRGVAERVHAAGALLIVAVDPLCLGLFRAPGDDGADVVVADGQALGLPMSFGGPHLGILATRRKYTRRLAGRLVGETTDGTGERGYVLTLATREQHIRRARATSNICTNAALTALAAAVYLATLGKTGLRQVAELCYHKSHYAASRINRIPNIAVNPQQPDTPFFKEFVISLPIPVDQVNAHLYDRFGITGGYDLGRDYADLKNHMLVAVTEMNTRESIDRFVAGLRDATDGGRHV